MIVTGYERVVARVLASLVAVASEITIIVVDEALIAADSCICLVSN